MINLTKGFITCVLLSVSITSIYSQHIVDLEGCGLRFYRSESELNQEDSIKVSGLVSNTIKCFESFDVLNKYYLINLVFNSQFPDQKLFERTEMIYSELKRQNIVDNRILIRFNSVDDAFLVENKDSFVSLKLLTFLE